MFQGNLGQDLPQFTEPGVPLGDSERGPVKSVAAIFPFAAVKPVRTPVAIFGSLGVCICVPASRHWLISYSPIHLA